MRRVAVGGCVTWLDDLLARAHAALLTPAGDEARTFLTSRGVTDRQIVDYQIGLGHPSVDIGACDVSFLPWVSEAWGHSVLFPLRSPLGQLTGVQSRSIVSKYYRPYYVVPAEVCPMLFGVQRTIEAIWATRAIVIVEGVFDFLAIEPYVPNAVAVLTAHVPRAATRFLSRYADTLTVLLDMDGPGREAAHRLAARQVCRFVRVPVYPAHDPSDLVQAGHIALLQRLTR